VIGRGCRFWSAKGAARKKPRASKAPPWEKRPAEFQALKGRQEFIACHGGANMMELENPF